MTVRALAGGGGRGFTRSVRAMRRPAPVEEAPQNIEQTPPDDFDKQVENKDTSKPIGE